MRSIDSTTPFADLNQLLAELVEGVRAALGRNFCGAYLQGSFAVGDADEHSDVDFIVVTDDDVTPQQRAELQSLHQRLYTQPTPWAQHLEGSYVPRRILRRPDPERRPVLYLDNGATEFTLDNHDNTAVVRWSLREHGIVLAGPNPHELIDLVSSHQLRDDVRRALDDWLAWLRCQDSISRRGLAVAVLSHCRILYTLATGGVSSKRVAGEWALRQLDQKWASLIGWALDDRPNPWEKVREQADPALVTRTLAFTDYAAQWEADRRE